MVVRKIAVPELIDADPDAVDRLAVVVEAVLPAAGVEVDWAPRIPKRGG
jgi:hypothetical protein